MAVGLLALVGGGTKVRAASGPYRRDVNRSYVAQGAVVVAQSNLAGTELAALMGGMASMQRGPLQSRLDTLVLTTSRTAASAAALSPPPPTGGIDQDLTAVLAERARAVVGVRSAVDGLLGMSPLPVPGTTGLAAAGTGTGRSDAEGGTGSGLPRTTPGRAAAQIVAAGTALSEADRTYASVRRTLREAPGNASLPRSAWVTDPQTWAPGPVQALVGALTSSPTLAPVTTVALVPGALRIVPQAVPPANGSSGGVATVPPTRTLGITAVVANQGNVDVGGVVVSAQAVPRGGGAPAGSSARVSLASTSSSTVALPDLKVVPGRTYTLTVSVRPPPAQVGRNGISETFTVLVAPLPPPTPAVVPTTTTVPKRRAKGVRRRPTT